MDESTRKQLIALARIILSQDRDILGLITSVTVLQREIATLRGEPLQDALKRFALLEREIVVDSPIEKASQRERDLLDALEHFGKNEA